jgi:hypothetical protein
MKWYLLVYNLLKIKPGKLKLKNRNFVFQLDSALNITADKQKTLLLIKGDNGSGKTTFLEQVIIPHLKQNKILFLFKGQDNHIQSIIDRSLEAIFSISHIGKDLITQILFNSQSSLSPRKISTPRADVLLMDETDKLLSSQDFYDIINNPDYKLLILISHNLDNPEFIQHFSIFPKKYTLSLQGQSAVRTASFAKC